MRTATQTGEDEKMKRYTVAEIAEANKQAGRYYFSPDTLRFFHQRRSDFSVFQTASRVYVYGRRSPSAWGAIDRPWTVGEFDPGTGEVDGCLPMELKHNPSTTARDILAALTAEERTA